MRTTLFALILPLMAMTAMPPAMPEPDSKIAFQNSIVVKVNGKTISMLDVKKKLDLFFHRAYPQLINSTPARFQFYQQSWRAVVMEMIDHELIIADALDKEIKLSDGEVREEMERRFGPNTLITLDKVGLSYDEAWKMVKDEMIVQRMSWWFIQSRAMQKVTPQDIRQAYRQYIRENPNYQEWKYRVVSIKGEEAGKVAGKVFELLSESGKPPEELAKELQALENDSTLIQISSELAAKETDLSESYKKHLTPLAPGKYSPPRTKTSQAKIFYCDEVGEHAAPKFEEIHAQLREKLLETAVKNESTAYIEKLRKNYGFDGNSLKTAIPEDLEPFSIE